MRFKSLKDKSEALLSYLGWLVIVLFIAGIGGCYWGTMASYNERPVYDIQPTVQDPMEQTNELGNRFVKVDIDKNERVHRWKYVRADSVCLNEKAKNVVGGYKAYDWDGLEVVVDPQSGERTPVYKECN